MPSPDMLGPSTLAVSNGISAFNNFLPKLSEVRKNGAKDDVNLVADIRMGEIAAVTLTMGVSCIASSFTGSAAPVVTGAFICLTMIVIYESALKGEDLFMPKGGK